MVCLLMAGGVMMCPMETKAETDVDIYYHTDYVGSTLGQEKYIDGHWYLLDKQTGEYVHGFVFLENTGKWVYYNSQGRMLHGEQCVNGHWYLFDQYTGAVTYGFAYIEKDDKWVFYDRVMGWMLYGEQCIDGGWYYLTPITGAVDFEWAWLPHSNKWVYYDQYGRMVYGEQYIDGKWEYFDTITGQVYSAQDKINAVVGKAYSAVNQHIDCPGILAANGGKTCHYGPCMSLVWWMFYESGMTGHLADGLNSGWPHENYDWYNSRGRVDKNPQVGDIAFFWFYNFAGVEGVSCSHAGLVVAVSGDSVLVIDALDSGIQPRWRSKSSIVGFAHPYY